MADATIASSWPEDGPTKLWQDSVGNGYGGASIHNGEVFLLDRVVGESDVLRCLDLNTGKEKWRFSYDAKGELPYPGSRSVPAVDEDYVWTVGPYGHMHCISRSTHKPVWSKNLAIIFEIDSLYFGIAQSPLLYKNTIIVATQGKLAGVVAFDKISGDPVWTSRKLKGGACYSSAMLGNIEGVDQVIALSIADRKDSTLTDEIVSFDAQTGEELWSYDSLKAYSINGPAVVLENNQILMGYYTYTTKWKIATMMLKVTKDEDKYTVKESFSVLNTGCSLHPPVVHNNYIYFNDNGRQGIMKCMSMAGEVVWTSDSIKYELGGMLLIGDYIVNQNGKNGDIHLIEATPEGYKELGKASFFDSEKSQAWSPLAFSDGKLIVRDNELVVCVDLESQ
jgi:outer membrane protein assembly factor BamB